MIPATGIRYSQHRTNAPFNDGVVEFDIARAKLPLARDTHALCQTGTPASTITSNPCEYPIDTTELVDNNEIRSKNLVNFFWRLQRSDEA